MTDADLDRCYTAVCESLADVGPERAQLFLSMLCLSLLARRDHAVEVLPLVEAARHALT